MVNTSFDVVDDAVADILRKKTEAERLAIAFGMWEFARQMIHSVVTAEHPDWSEQEVKRQVARRLSHGAV